MIIKIIRKVRNYLFGYVLNKARRVKIYNLLFIRNTEVHLHEILGSKSNLKSLSWQCSHSRSQLYPSCHLGDKVTLLVSLVSSTAAERCGDRAS